MFLQDTDYESIISEEELGVICGGDINKRRKAETSAITKIRHRLSKQFDCDAIFDATGADRDETIIEYVIYYAIYILYSRIAKEKVPADRYMQYDEAREFFNLIADNKINSNLPRLKDVLGTEETPAIRFGSDKRLNHE